MNNDDNNKGAKDTGEKSNGERNKTSWWQTLPGILTAAAGIITAVTGLIIALNQVGIFDGNKAAQNRAESGTASSVGSSPVFEGPSSHEASPETPPESNAGLAAAAELPVAANQTASINLLSMENGGQLIVAPNQEWSVTNDGKEDNYREVKVGEEAVFAFKDERAATFDRFDMLIPKSGRNPKEFELFAGSESPTGEFHSIGTFHPQNIRLMKTEGWQTFKFAPVTATYLKIKLRSNYEDVVWLDLYEFRLQGQLSAASAH
ncbi:MAG: hypothetical protein JWM78_1741 [Verrucomicrobiaceae bacterium]|nr:hypothetical protein [Verrucomicrobiaceae bacterium]